MRYLNVLLLLCSSWSVCFGMLLPSTVDKLQNRFTTADITSENLLKIFKVWKYETVANISFEHVEDLLGQSNCIGDLFSILQALKSKSFWAMLMLDSFGKPEADILLGNIHWIGDFSACHDSIIRGIKLHNDSAPSFNPQYCLAEFSLGGLNVSKLPPFSSAICIPNSCNETDILSLLTFLPDLIPQLKPYLNVINFSNINCPKKWEVSSSKTAIASCVVLGLVGLLLIIGTIADGILIYRWKRKQRAIIKEQLQHSQRSNETPTMSSIVPEEDEILISSSPSFHTQSTGGENILELFSIFSIYSNCKKIFCLKKAEGSLPSLHGIRVLSMSWVILGHSFAVLAPYINNIAAVPDKINNSLILQIVPQGVFAVDTFFLLSGLLVAYNYFRARVLQDLDGRFSWIYYYVHRYWRLTPALSFAIIFSIGILPYLTFGPFTTSSRPDVTACEKYWWWNILYINNFKDSADMCYPLSWYLANDMQFYIIAPLILVPLASAKFAPLGAIIGFAILLANWISCGIISTHNQFPVGISAYLQNISNFANYNEYFDKIYDKPYCRIAPYIIGIYCGWLLVKCQGKLKIRKITSVILTCAAIALNAVVVFGLFQTNLGVKISALYEALSRTAWAVSVGWLIVATCTNNGGIVNRILSMEIWMPFSRLTYCAYLFHMCILEIVLQERESLVHYTHATVLYFFLGSLLLSYAFALLATLAFESPALACEKYVLRKLGRSPTPSPEPCVKYFEHHGPESERT